jgi:hypothetical protein
MEPVLPPDPTEQLLGQLTRLRESLNRAVPVPARLTGKAAAGWWAAVREKLPAEVAEWTRAEDELARYTDEYLAEQARGRKRGTPAHLASTDGLKQATHLRLLAGFRHGHIPTTLADLHAYIYMALGRTLTDIAGARRTLYRHEQPAGGPPDFPGLDPADGGPSPSAAVAWGELDERVWALVESLPAADRPVAVLWYGSGCDTTIEELAAATGVARAEVKKIRAAFRERLTSLHRAAATPDPAPPPAPRPGDAP